MNKFEDLSREKKLEYLSQLLPDYHEDYSQNVLYDKKNQIYDRLGKAYLYDSKSGKKIITQLEEINFYVNEYSDVEQFLLVLSYIVLTHAQRIIVERKKGKRDVYPNRKLISNIKRIDVDADIKLLASFFLVLSDTYNNLIKELKNDTIKRSIEIDDFKLIESFNKHLLFQYREFESDNRIKFNKMYINLTPAECQSLSRIGSIYDDAYLSYIDNEEIFLRENLKRICLCNSIREAIECFGSILQGGYLSHLCMQDVMDAEDYFFLFTYCIRFMIATYEIIYMISLTAGTENNGVCLLKSLDEVFKSTFDMLEKRTPIIRRNIQKNIFMKFASFLLSLSYEKKYEYVINVSDSIVAHLDVRSVGDKAEMDRICFSENMIDGLKTKELLDYIVPDVNQRKPSDRNEVKRRLKYVMRVLDYLSEKNPVYGVNRYGKQLKIMYLLIYDNNMKEFIVSKQLPKKLYDGEIEKIENSDFVILTESYIYAMAVIRGHSNVYEYFKNNRKKLLNKSIELLGIVTKRDD